MKNSEFSKVLEELAKEHGTPLFVVDHEILRRNYREFNSLLPRVQAYYAVKANPAPEIIHTLYDEGASFDVASIAEFRLVYENIKEMDEEFRKEFIWDKIIYANPIKGKETLKELDKYDPLVSFDNDAELEKIKKYAPHAGLMLRIKVPNIGSMVELSSKFGAEPGEALGLIERAAAAGLTVEGLCFHVGSQCMKFDNYVQAILLCSKIMDDAADKGFKMKILDIGGGFPVSYDGDISHFPELADIINNEIDRLIPKGIDVIAEPGRFMVATAGFVVAEVTGRAEREGKQCYYINDGIYGTYSGVFFDKCRYIVKSFREGETHLSTVFGPTCDALDVVSRSEFLPMLELGDLVYSENIGAYSHATSTGFNGFPPARILHINQQ